jgi:flavin reductase (DIM6/NTAB) family NADH-FMN oxidoreductase RutF
LSRSLTDLLLKPGAFPQYVAVGLSDPQDMVDVWLRGASAALDVTRNSVVTALRPFTVGIMFPEGDPRAGANARLCFQERGSNRLLGSIDLRFARAIPLPGRRFSMFETPRSENFCLPAPMIGAHYLYQRLRIRSHQKKNPYNFRMSFSDVLCNFTFYIAPRPVVLVSVEFDGSSNLFPMDLIGPTDSPWFSMALRGTSPAVKLMQQSRRMALASMPLRFKQQIYELGKHHQLKTIDWAALPFPVAPSPLYGLRVPQDAIRIREVRVEEFHEVGSHVVFITSVERETETGARDLQMFHLAGTYWKYLQRKGTPAVE